MTIPGIRRWMMVTFAASIVVLLISYLFTTFGAGKACGPLPYDMPPILAFEFARSPADLAALFGTGESICRVQLLRALERINLLDYAYVPAYGLMLLAFLMALSQGRRSALVKLGLACALVAPAADAVENWILLSLGKNLDVPSLLSWLKYPVHLKFICIAVAGAVAGMLLWQTRTLWLQVSGLLLLPQLVPAIITVFAPMSYSGALLTPLIGLAWALIMLLAMIGMARPELFKPRN